MRASISVLSAALCGMLAVVRAADDEGAALVTKQKQAMIEKAKLAQVPEQLVESPNLLLCGTIGESNLKTISALLEKQYTTAVAALQFDKTDKPWFGKLGVFLFPDRNQFRSFIRIIEKRSPEDGEQGSQSLKGDTPHISAGPGRTTGTGTIEVQAGQELCAAILAGRAKATPLPDWVVIGFARATAAHAAGQAAGVRKKGARDLVRGRVKPREAWGENLPYAQRITLATAIMDFLVYGGGAPKPVEFLGGFRPDDEKATKTADDALAATKMTVDQFETAFIRWLSSAK
jgi:hypothetical protein